MPARGEDCTGQRRSEGKSEAVCPKGHLSCLKGFLSLSDHALGPLMSEVLFLRGR